MKDLLEALGGAPEIAKKLGLAPNRVSNWRLRGVPWRYRLRLAKMAEEKSVKLPPRFLDSEAA